MRALFHDDARQGNRALDPLHAGDGAAVARRAVHDGRIQFIRALAREYRTLTGIEELGLLHDLNGGNNRIKRCASLL